MTQTKEQVLEQYRDVLLDTLQRLYEGVYTGELAEEIDQKLQDLPDPEECPSATSQRELLTKKLAQLRSLVSKRCCEAVDSHNRISELEELLDQQEAQYYRVAEERNALKQKIANIDTVKVVRSAFADTSDRLALKELIKLVQDFLAALNARDAGKMYRVGLQFKAWLEINKPTVRRLLDPFKKLN